MLKKFLFMVMTFSILVLAAGCSDDKNDEQGQVQSEMKRVLADGSEVAVPSNSVDEELMNWLMEKQIELQRLIAEELAVKKETVAVMTSKVSDDEVSASIVLGFDPDLDEKSIQKLVEDIINVFSGPENISIKEENIIITDNKANIIN